MRLRLLNWHSPSETTSLLPPKGKALVTVCIHVDFTFDFKLFWQRLQQLASEEDDCIMVIILPDLLCSLEPFKFSSCAQYQILFQIISTIPFYRSVLLDNYSVCIDMICTERLWTKKLILRKKDSSRTPRHMIFL